MTTNRSRIVLSCLCLLSLVSACEPDETRPKDAVDMCRDLVSAEMEMHDRCGTSQPQYVDCDDVVGISDVDGLYEVCIPAIESSCVEGDTPPEWRCHVLVFGVNPL